jgi:glycerate kinase
VAPDSFKESLSAIEAAECIAAGLRKAAPRCEVVIVPMADGGEGTVSAMVSATEGRRLKANVTGPLGEPVEAEFGVLGDGRTAIIEMAAASGLELVSPGKRNPMLTTTFGTGELIRAALDAGCRKIIVGVGGSATVDGGVGMAQALGGRFVDAEGKPIGRGGGALAALHAIDLLDMERRLRETRVEVACDVNNPLTGPKGAAEVYGPQKGATPAMVFQLETSLQRLAAVIRYDLGVEVEELPGAGAAGGIAAGLVAFLGAELRPGVDVVIESVGLEEKMAGCDLVVTGEGKLDSQTAHGKAPAGVARLAAGLGIPVIAFAGCVEDHPLLVAAGLGASFGIVSRPMPHAEALRRAPELLTAAAEQAFRAFLMGLDA